MAMRDWLTHDQFCWSRCPNPLSELEPTMPRYQVESSATLRSNPRTGAGTRNSRIPVHAIMLTAPAQCRRHSSQGNTVTGNTLIVGKMTELSSSIVRITGDGCEMFLYFRETSEYEYNDARDPSTEGHVGQTSKYPIVIDITFSPGDHLEVSEFPANGGVQ